ncbi:MAG: UbiA-like polyprenyltransferase [Bacteroidota bacterium]
MKKVNDYLLLIKFSHTVFALPFALIGFFWGVYSNGFAFESGAPALVEYFRENTRIFLFILLCMVFARSAAMAFNRYLDREFDAQNPRTAIREIPRGIISPASALRFTLLNALLFVGSAGMINATCLYLSPIALLVILGYSYTKRFTALCHLVLGIGLSLAPLGAYIAVTESVEPSILLLSCSVMCWVSGFDILYALQDQQFDSEKGLLSIPVALGATRALAVSRMLHVLCATGILAAGWMHHAEFVYYVGSTCFIGLLVYQQSIVGPTDLSRINIAFMTANGIGSIVFAIFAIADQIIS